jgi:alkylated DNA repair protein alkB family protein 7
MRFVQSIEDPFKATDSYRNQPKNSDLDLYSCKVLLRRRSLYIMSHSARYNFTHEILANEESFINGVKVEKDRRISIICRNEPENEE